MIPVKDSDPVLVGNKVESVVPYLLSDEFVVVAKEDGKVVDISNEFCIIEYKSGKRYAIDISTRIRKNSSNGSWTDNTLKCDLKVGDKVKESDILAYNEKQFTPNTDDNGISMNLGVLAKVALSSQWDIFEDSAPISKRIAEKQKTEVVDEKSVTLSKNTYIENIVKVGDTIEAGDTLITFSDAQDESIRALLDNMSEGEREVIIDSAKTTIKSKYTGEVVEIKMYTTVPTEELHPSLKDIVESHLVKVKNRNETLDKYKNEDDMNYYKLGQIINEDHGVTTVGRNGKIKSHIINETDDVLILFYIKYTLSASKGDKVVVSVCKGIISHVFEEGLEPYSEYRPEEVIDTFIAPLAVAARKVPAIFLSMFSNKLVIEEKRQLRDIYLGE